MKRTLEMRNIVKRFPGVLANDHANLTVQAGEIHALLGENGAGKSTLMQILYGFHRMDSGEMLIDGARIHLSSPRDAIALGIGMVHQEFMLVRPFSVVENTILGLRESGGATLDLRKAAQKLESLSDRHGLALDPHAEVQSLPIGVQQRVEILKLLYRDARVLILDEPTAVLTKQEKDQLFAVLRGLRAEGRSILLVTHKLNEIMEIADRVTVMRDGRSMATRTVGTSSEQELTRLMVGRDVNLRTDKSPRQPGEPLLQVSDLRVVDQKGREKVCGITLEVRAGEILGIAGVDGNGQSHLAEAIMHLREVKKRPRAAERRGHHASQRRAPPCRGPRVHPGRSPARRLGDGNVRRRQRDSRLAAQVHAWHFSQRPRGARIGGSARRTIWRARLRHRPRGRKAFGRQSAEAHPRQRNHARGQASW